MPLPSKSVVRICRDPQTPVLQTKHRTRPVTCKSAADLEAEELEKQQQWVPLAVFEEEFQEPACFLFTSVGGAVTVFLALGIMVFELQALPCLCDERIESGSRELSWSVNWLKKKSEVGVGEFTIPVKSGLWGLGKSHPFMATQGIVTTVTSAENWNLMWVKSGGCLL